MNDLLPNSPELIECAALSDIGLRRSNNQDAFVVLLAEDETTWRQRGHLFIVADGMGAHAAGELASKLAADGVAHHYRRLRQVSPPEALLRALRDTNGEIHQRGQANAEFHNMGTTCSSLALLPQGALVAHVGDSRVYRCRGDRLEQLTFDHSLVWEMRAANSSLSEQAVLSIPKNVITRSLGPQGQVMVDLEGPLEVRPGDTFLLCSDGLTGRVEDEELALILSLYPPTDAIRLLVDLANIRGGPDNITAIIVRVGESAAPTAHWRGEPLVVGQELRPSRPVPAWVWSVIVLGIVLGAGLTILQMYWLAGGALMAAGLAGLVPWWQTRPQEDGVPLTGGRRLGRAPYTTVDLVEPVRDLTRLHQRIVELVNDQEEIDAGTRERIQACLAETEAKLQRREITEGARMLSVAIRIFAEQIART